MTTTLTTRPTTEHVLTVVEPTADGDASLDIAHDVVARGGSASVLMLITDRVRRDIAAYAASEDLSTSEAEAQAIERLAEYCVTRIGGDVETTVAVEFGRFGGDLRRRLATDTTTIAVPEQLLTKRSLRSLASTTGLPVLVAPRSVAA